MFNVKNGVLKIDLFMDGESVTIKQAVIVMVKVVPVGILCWFLVSMTIIALG